MAGEGSSGSATIEHTPTWATAALFSFFVFISWFLVQSTSLLSKIFKKHGMNAWKEAMERIREELMILGFISLLLAALQRPISYICIPTSAANTMLPCHRIDELPVAGESHRRLLWMINPRRKLSGSGSDHCGSRGMVSLVSLDGIHQLHILIFVLAVVHIFHSVVTMALGRAQMRRWKVWESETQTLEYQVENDPRRFRLMRETTYARRHVNVWTETPILTWMTCFFRQFFSSVAKVDYFTLRHGFISAHFPSLTVFDFHKYIERSLEDDFKTVLRISPIMWFLVVIFMLIDVYGWYSYFWLSFLPLVAVLASGTKLHYIVAKMGLKLNVRNTVINGTPVVEPNDDLFWFGKPKLVLFLIHFTLFQNAFQLSFFIWVWYEFGLRSCYHEKLEFAIARVCLALVVQFLCSYITLPLYALVTQMGSKFNRTMFEEETAKCLREWHEGVKMRRKKKKKEEKASTSCENSVRTFSSTAGDDESSVSRKGKEVEMKEI